MANEVVGILQAFGMILKVSDAILGLTVFAMVGTLRSLGLLSGTSPVGVGRLFNTCYFSYRQGNSLGDLVANITIARMGFPRMAFSACFGGPLLSM